jgi:hypothetical protein
MSKVRTYIKNSELDNEADKILSHFRLLCDKVKDNFEDFPAQNIESQVKKQANDI